MLNNRKSVDALLTGAIVLAELLGRYALELRGSTLLEALRFLLWVTE